MSSLTSCAPIVKPGPKTRSDRSVRLLASIDTTAGPAGFFRVRQKCQGRREPEVTTYSFAEVPCDIGGRGFVVEKVDPATGRTLETYHTRIDGEHLSCDCRGFLRHQLCKHTDALIALVAAERL